MTLKDILSLPDFVMRLRNSITNFVLLTYQRQSRANEL